MTTALHFAVPDLAPPPAFEVIVRDEPVPSGIRPVPLRRGGEVIGSRLAEGRDHDHEKRIRAWRETLQSAAQRAMGGRDRLLGPLAVEFTFLRPRLDSHYGTGRNAGELKASAPAFPTTRPDALKLARLVEDALTGPVWKDDAQIVDERLCKLWVPVQRPPGVRVRVWDLPALERHADELARILERLQAVCDVDAGETFARRLEALAADVARGCRIDAAELRGMAAQVRVNPPPICEDGPHG